MIFCCVLVSAYIFLMLFALVGSRFDTAELPNGTLMNRRHIFAGDPEGNVPRDPEGKILVGEGIYSVCYNDRFVAGSTEEPLPWTRYGTLSFIYEKDAPEAVYSDDPRYRKLWERSGLETPRGCGTGGAWQNWKILVDPPRFPRLDLRP